MTKFEDWLAKLVGQKPSDVKKLLGSENALHFLIAWSLLESKCFGGYEFAGKLESFAQQLAIDKSFTREDILGSAGHFHDRYQNKTYLKNLLPRDPNREKDCSKKFKDLLDRDLDSLTPKENIFLVLFVVHRFRNNIFHGNKPVESWLQFGDQIALCTKAMQSFVSHAETLKSSLKHE